MEKAVTDDVRLDRDKVAVLSFWLEACFFAIYITIFLSSFSMFFLGTQLSYIPTLSLLLTYLLQSYVDDLMLKSPRMRELFPEIMKEYGDE